MLAGLGANDLFGTDAKDANEDSGMRFLKIGCIAAILGTLALFGALLAVAATPTPTTGGSSMAAFLSLVQDLEIIVLVGALISAISSAFLFLGFRKLSNIESEFETPSILLLFGAVGSLVSGAGGAIELSGLASFANCASNAPDPATLANCFSQSSVGLGVIIVAVGTLFLLLSAIGLLLGGLRIRDHYGSSAALIAGILVLVGFIISLFGSFGGILSLVGYVVLLVAVSSLGPMGVEDAPLTWFKPTPTGDVAASTPPAPVATTAPSWSPAVAPPPQAPLRAETTGAVLQPRPVAAPAGTPAGSGDRRKLMLLRKRVAELPRAPETERSSLRDAILLDAEEMKRGCSAAWGSEVDAITAPVRPRETVSAVPGGQLSL